MISENASISSVNSRHKKTLAALFALPTLASVVFVDIEALLKALGAKVTEREGSRVMVELHGEQWRGHRPHPGKEAKRYQVEEIRELLERLGIRP
jgi:HicA toxin of bacterial toxin-antitoxin,